MSYFNQFWEWMIGELMDMGVIEEAAEMGYEVAMDMCGNEGQISVIEMTGESAFYEAAEAAATAGGGTYEILVAACPYPEAVDQILQEAAATILDHINEGVDEYLSEGDADEEGDSGDGDLLGGDGSFWWDD